MRIRRLSATLGFLFLLGIAACSHRASEEAARARADLNQICHAQRSYLETLRLMKSANPADLAKERAAHFEREVKTTLIQDALHEAQRAPAGQRRRPLELAAAKSGVDGWSCPELDQL